MRIDRETLKKQIEFALVFLNGLKKVIPGEVDDFVIDLLGKAKDQDWVLDLLVYVINNFDKFSFNKEDVIKLVMHKG
jgi:hypothetical protein